METGNIKFAGFIFEIDIYFEIIFNSIQWYHLCIITICDLKDHLGKEVPVFIVNDVSGMLCAKVFVITTVNGNAGVGIHRIKK